MYANPSSKLSPLALGSYCCQCYTPVPPGWYCCSFCADRMNGATSQARNQSFFGMYPPIPVDSVLGPQSIEDPSQRNTEVDQYKARSGTCRCCDKHIEAGRAINNDTCSKRCEWVAQCQCPQCGRRCLLESPFNEQPYCSAGCASQSHQANWCPTCGVKQILVGSTHCSTACAGKSHCNFPIRPRKKVAQHNNNLRHEVMKEKDRNALLQSLRSVFSDLGLVVVNVVQCTPHTIRRKNFLTYRASVEHEMSAGRLSKYGFGGEGNEQRRYMPLSVECSLGPAGNPFAVAGSCAECCEDSRCTTCSSLRNGLQKDLLGTISHYCTTELELSILHAAANKSRGSLCAVGVCRAVIGMPSFVRDPSEIVPGVDGTHCTIITNGEGSKNEATYLFRDDAIDLQYVILFR